MSFMKILLLSLLSTLVVGLVCFLPAVPARADTIYVATYFDASIWKYDTDGTGSLFVGPTIFGPAGLAYDQAGNLYVANANNNTIEKFTTNGVASVFAADPGDNSVMNGPRGLAFDAHGNLYTVNYFGSSVTKFTTNGTASIFATDDGSGSVVISPEGLAFDKAGNLYVANSGGNYIEKFDSTGYPSRFADDPGDGSLLDSPAGLAFDTNGNLYVANGVPASWSPSIVRFDPAGNGSIFATNMLDSPQSLAFDKAGNLYVANYGQNDVVKITPGGVSSVAAGIAYPDGMVFDSSGDLVIGSDWGYIEKFDTNGVLVSTIHSTVYNVNGLAVDSAGNLYAANSVLTGTIEKFDTNGVGTVFASHLYPSYGMAVDGADNLYVVYDYEDLIYKYAPDGSGAVFATNGLTWPNGLARDGQGNFFVVNAGTNTIVKINAAGQASVFATNTMSYTGAFGPDLAVDPANNVYVLGDLIGTTIVRYTPAGVPSAFAENPGQTYPHGNAQGMAFDSATNLYVANFYSGNIYKFDRSGNGTVFASGLNEPVAIAIRRTGAVAVSPQLFITTSGTNALIRWTLAAPNYTLQSNTNLAGTNWTAVSGTPGTNNGNYVYTNGVTGSARFFRLKRN
jgi:DNA-binding beta-propeller fold protein YncE